MARRLACMAAVCALGLALLACGAVPTAPTPTAAPTATVEPTSAVEPAPTTAPLLPEPIRFLDLADGGAAILTDGPLGPEVYTSVEADGVEGEGRIFLQADGLVMAMERNSAAADPFRTALTWQPWRGNGEYVLEISSWPMDACCIQASKRITVTVAGFPEGVPSIRDRFIGLYQENFGLTLTAPAFARYVKPWSDALDASRWVSAAYVGDMLYEINLFDDGTTSAISRPLNHVTEGWSSVCRPAGRYKMLVVFVDYGNTGVTQAQALAALDDAAAEYNRRYAAWAAALGASESPLQIDVTGAYVAPPPTPGEALTVEQVRALSGEDPTLFDILVEIDLDADMTFSQSFDGVGFGGTGCNPGGPPGIDIYFPVTDYESLTQGFLGSVFDHELSHGMGWQHWWPNGDGSVATQFTTDWHNNPSMPTFLFGWSDVDGDGVIDILDPTPYGME